MKRISILLFVPILSFQIFAQQIDLGNTQNHFSKENLLKISGNFSASSIFYTGNELHERNPFTYYLNGTINLNIMNLINTPFTFNFTNSGSNYTYPTMPNRLSIHPRYKWITGHIGDVSMNFSPYTMNGHLFTGVGIDLTPTSSPLKIGFMYGRIRRAVEYGNGNPNVQVSYKRTGSGARVRYEKSKYQVGASIFGAKDDINSLKWQPDSLSVFPEANIAISFDAGIQLINNLRLTTEYGISLLNRDIRKNNVSDTKFRAIRTSLNYTLKNNTIGIGYERIDPGYKTLGAYYFNNDLENITLNFARPFLKNKGSIAFSGGIEHDDLNKTKESQTRRFISSVNIGYIHSDYLNFNLAYSGFQTYMNIKSPFDYINELTPYDNLDTLNYTQITQSFNFMTNYTINKNKSFLQNLNFNLGLQEAADKRGEIVPEGGATLFYNSSLGYGIQYLPKQINSNLNFNLSANRMSGQNSLILGPTFNINVPLLDKKINTTFILSHNTNYIEGKNQASVWNIRFNTGYILLKKHRFNLNMIYRNNQTQSINNNIIYNGLSISTGYNYIF